MDLGPGLLQSDLKFHTCGLDSCWVQWMGKVILFYCFTDRTICSGVLQSMSDGPAVVPCLGRQKEIGLKLQFHSSFRNQKTIILNLAYRPKNHSTIWFETGFRQFEISLHPKKNKFHYQIKRHRIFVIKKICPLLRLFQSSCYNRIRTIKEWI